MDRRYISSGSDFEKKIGYSRAVIDGEYVFVAGTTGYDYDTMSISSNPIEQAEQCFKNIKKALLEAGSDLKNIIRIRYILPDKNDFEPCWPVFRKYLKEAKPAATMFVAGLLDDKIKIEIEVTARLNA